jgi:hypothetical protein
MGAIRTKYWLLGWTSALALAGCGGGTSGVGPAPDASSHDGPTANDMGTPNDGPVLADGGSEMGAFDGGQDAADGGGQTDARNDSAPSCPTSPPGVGSACSDIGEQCEYGSSPDPACNEIFDCTANGWQKTSAVGPTCPGPDGGFDSGGGCPMQPPTGACSDLGETCNYATETCVCSNGSPPPVFTSWHCTMPGPGCPEPRPAIGSSCSMPGLMCDYGHCNGGVELDCTNGIWQIGGGPCPG